MRFMLAFALCLAAAPAGSDQLADRVAAVRAAATEAARMVGEIDDLSVVYTAAAAHWGIDVCSFPGAGLHPYRLVKLTDSEQDVLAAALAVRLEFQMKKLGL